MQIPLPQRWQAAGVSPCRARLPFRRPVIRDECLRFRGLAGLLRAPGTACLRRQPRRVLRLMPHRVALLGGPEPAVGAPVRLLARVYPHVALQGGGVPGGEGAMWARAVAAVTGAPHGRRGEHGGTQRVGGGPDTGNNQARARREQGPGAHEETRGEGGEWLTVAASQCRPPGRGPAPHPGPERVRNCAPQPQAPRPGHVPSAGGGIPGSISARQGATRTPQLRAATRPPPHPRMIPGTRADTFNGFTGCMGGGGVGRERAGRDPTGSEPTRASRGQKLRRVPVGY